MWQISIKNALVFRYLLSSLFLSYLYSQGTCNNSLSDIERDTRIHPGMNTTNFCGHHAQSTALLMSHRIRSAWMATQLNPATPVVPASHNLSE